MKKLLYIMTLMAITLLYTSVSHADGRGWKHGRGHRQHHHGHHHHHYYPRPRVRYYYPAPEVYYPAPPVAYVPAPPPAYYPPAPVYPNYYNQKSSQGLAGGVIGSVFGYEIGNGDPIAAGLGAAAGSYLGNGIARRY